MLLSCNMQNTTENETGTSETVSEEAPPSVGGFGDAISEDGAIEASLISEQIGVSDSFPAKLTGTITDVCQKKGCWMMVDIGNGKSMRVTFRDYGFFVPKDCTGKTAIVEGYAYHDTVSIETLRHFAEESGKPETEINAITAPEIAVAFEANGVIIK